VEKIEQERLFVATESLLCLVSSELSVMYAKAESGKEKDYLEQVYRSSRNTRYGLEAVLKEHFLTKKWPESYEAEREAEMNRRAKWKQGHPKA